jgi:hypothetical protein
LTAFVAPAQAGVQASRTDFCGVCPDARFRGHD